MSAPVTIIPPGFALVPIEPTTGMAAALLYWAKDNPNADLFVGTWLLGSFREDYQKMLAAAPKPSDQPAPTPSSAELSHDHALVQRCALAAFSAQPHYAGDNEVITLARKNQAVMAYDAVMRLIDPNRTLQISINEIKQHQEEANKI